MSSFGLTHYNKHVEMFRHKSDRHLLVDLLTSSAILGIKKALLSVRVYSQP